MSELADKIRERAKQLDLLCMHQDPREVPEPFESFLRTMAADVLRRAARAIEQRNGCTVGMTTKDASMLFHAADEVEP